MVTKCKSCPLRSRPVFAPMNANEISFMQCFKSGELDIDAGATLMQEGSNSPQLFTALSGMGLRYKMLESGERQVINFILPGDFIGLQAGVMQEMGHSVDATTRMTLCVFDRKDLWRLFRDHPERAFDLTWLSAVEEHLLGESLAVLGRMDGIERVARAFVILFDRASAVGLTQTPSMPLPYKQQDLADALGLSLVHTNKTLKKLRDLGVANWRNGHLDILDYAELCRIALLEPDHPVPRRPLI